MGRRWRAGWGESGRRRPVVYSDDAGAYVCETVCWTLLDHRLTRGGPARAAFLHLPPVSEHFTVELLAGAVRRVVKAAAAGGNIPAGVATH